jgi:predicted dehydrogenase
MIKINIRTNEPGLLRRRGDRPEYIDVRQREHLLAVACGRAEPVTPARRRELPVNPVRWGLLATASIGRVMVEAARRLTAARFVAVASRDGDRARQFAAGLGLDRAFASYEALLEYDGVDAIYVALPISMHTEWTVKALRAGKHVLCEKPFALSPADAASAFDAAADARRVCAEGFMYRYHPQTVLVQRLVRQGQIGTLRHVRSALSVSVPAGDIRRNRALGGGAYLDLGSYRVSAARLFAGPPQRPSPRLSPGCRSAVRMRSTRLGPSRRSSGPARPPRPCCGADGGEQQRFRGTGWWCFAGRGKGK